MKARALSSPSPAPRPSRGPTVVDLLEWSADDFEGPTLGEGMDIEKEAHDEYLDDAPPRSPAPPPALLGPPFTPVPPRVWGTNGTRPNRSGRQPGQS
jgi:hypothetical protein